MKKVFNRIIKLIWRIMFRLCLNPINMLVKKYLLFLKFKNYYYFYIHGPKDRVIWEHANNLTHAPNIFLNTKSGKIIIGNGTIFGPDCMLLTGRHLFEQGILKMPVSKQVPEEGYDINIGYGCWIASRAIVLGGAKIQDNSILCAGAIVTKKFHKPGVILAGVPAKIIKYVDGLENNHLDLIKEEI